MITDAQIEVLSDLAVTYGLSLPNLLLDAEAGRIVVLAEDWGAPVIQVSAQLCTNVVKGAEIS